MLKGSEAEEEPEEEPEWQPILDAGDPRSGRCGRLPLQQPQRQGSEPKLLEEVA